MLFLIVFVRRNKEYFKIEQKDLCVTIWKTKQGVVILSKKFIGFSFAVFSVIYLFFPHLEIPLDSNYELNSVRAKVRAYVFGDSYWRKQMELVDSKIQEAESKEKFIVNFANKNMNENLDYHKYMVKQYKEEGGADLDKKLKSLEYEMKSDIIDYDLEVTNAKEEKNSEIKRLNKIKLFFSSKIKS